MYVCYSCFWAVPSLPPAPVNVHVPVHADGNMDVPGFLHVLKLVLLILSLPLNLLVPLCGHVPMSAPVFVFLDLPLLLLVKSRLAYLLWHTFGYLLLPVSVPVLLRQLCICTCSCLCLCLSLCLYLCLCLRICLCLCLRVYICLCFFSAFAVPVFVLVLVILDLPLLLSQQLCCVCACCV